MPEAFSLGPLLIPTRAAGFILLLLLAFWLVRRIALALKEDSDRYVQAAERSAWLGLLAARLVFALLNWASYSERPWTVLYFWQPGYSLVAGIIVAVVFLLFKVYQQDLASRKNMLLSLTAGFAVPVLIFSGLLLSMNRFAAPGVVVPGKMLPASIVSDLKGQPVGFADSAAKGRVVNFWATWCPPCRREMPLLESVYQQYREQGIEIIGVATDSDRQLIEDYVNRVGVNYPVWQDFIRADGNQSGMKRLSQQFGVVGYPTTFFVDAKGVVQSSYVGELNLALLNQRIAGIKP